MIEPASLFGTKALEKEYSYAARLCKRPGTVWKVLSMLTYTMRISSDCKSRVLKPSARFNSSVA